MLEISVKHQPPNLLHQLSSTVSDQRLSVRFFSEAANELHDAIGELKE
jgi:hypothetical protein